MSLAIITHALTVYSMTEPTDGTTLAVSVPTAGSGTDVDGQLISKTTSALYQSHNIILNNGFLFLFNLPNQTYFKVGYRCTLGSREFAVRSECRVFDAGDECDYGDVVLEELNLA